MQSPTHYADTLGQVAVKQLGEPVRKDHGIYLTPEPIARFMASRLTVTGASLRVLDPAAGAGILSCALIEQLVRSHTPPNHIHIVGYEIHPELHDVLNRSLTHAASWAAIRGVTVTVETYCDDYVLATVNQPLGGDGVFDLVIANPPYFKLGSKDPRQAATRHLVPSQPNIYSLFMALSARSLRPAGEMIYIVPRSFASGVYFKPFRQDFFSRIQPLSIHLFGSRRQAFKRDAVLQENVILHGIRHDNWSHEAELRLSHSDGVTDLEHPERWNARFADLVDRNAPGLVLRLPASGADQTLMHTIDTLPETLQSLGLAISTGPVVGFRSRDEIRDDSSPEAVPLLWLHHVTPGRLRHPVPGRTGQYVATTKQKLLVPIQNCVVLRRFSAKDEPRRLTAAPLLERDFPDPWIGIENHLNYLYRPETGLTEDEAQGLAAILNSLIMDRYFRAVSGNTQVGAAELRAMPLPSIGTITQIGRWITDQTHNSQAIDDLIMREARVLEGMAAD